MDYSNTQGIVEVRKNTANMETPQKQITIESKPLTTFVQVDTETFKDVVQRLTGSSDIVTDSGYDLGTGKANIGVKRPEFKLHERRQYKAKMEIIKPPLSIRQQVFPVGASENRVVQSSPLTTPTKCFSGLWLVEREHEGEPVVADLNTREEEKAIKERRFYLHPSPRSKPGFIEPELLSLFPLTSPETSKEQNNVVTRCPLPRHCPELKKRRGNVDVFIVVDSAGNHIIDHVRSRC